MEAISIAATDETPAVILDKAAGKFEISGKSLPEDVTQFFDPILAWLDEYGEDPNDQTTLELKMVYFNTASSKLILDILLKLEEIAEDGADVAIKWHYQEDDEDMEETGEEFSDIVEIPFEMIAY